MDRIETIGFPLWDWFGLKRCKVHSVTDFIPSLRTSGQSWSFCSAKMPYCCDRVPNGASDSVYRDACSWCDKLCGAEKNAQSSHAMLICSLCSLSGSQMLRHCSCTYRQAGLVTVSCFETSFTIHCSTCRTCCKSLCSYRVEVDMKGHRIYRLIGKPSTSCSW